MGVATVIWRRSHTFNFVTGWKFSNLIYHRTLQLCRRIKWEACEWVKTYVFIAIVHTTYICLFLKWNIVLWNMSKCVLAVPLAPENTFYVEFLVDYFSLLLNKGHPPWLSILRSSQYEFSIKFQTLSNCCIYILNLTDLASHCSWKLYASSWSCIHRSVLLDDPLCETI